MEAAAAVEGSKPIHTSSAETERNWTKKEERKDKKMVDVTRKHFS